MSHFPYFIYCKYVFELYKCSSAVEKWFIVDSLNVSDIFLKIVSETALRDQSDVLTKLII